jgi:hypothetical protein
MSKQPIPPELPQSEVLLADSTQIRVRDLHVKGIPESVWCRARCNATRSGLAFKMYIIKILEASEPILPSAPRALPPGA